MNLNARIKKAVRGFTLDIAFSNVLAAERGRLGILGASGCGKSMTLKSLAGIVRPDSGRIELDGELLYDSAARVDIPPQQRRIGYLFQNYALFPHLTVTDNIACGLRLSHAEAAADRRIAALIEQMQLQGLEQHYPRQLSGGQQQRVALARILAYQPRLILLDEPFSALDQYLKDQVQQQLSELLTGLDDQLIMVSHNRDELYRFCSRLLVMDNGRIIGSGATKELFAQPGKTQIARLTGCKNISAARRTGSHSVYAEDWGVTLRSEREVGADISAVGVRAHDFYPAASDAVNAFAVTVEGVSESPFEQSMICRAAGSERLWWQYAKDGGAKGMPEYLAVHPAKVLLLT
ncbi:MAG: ATP-binding cassette domain-containing protein [Bacillota bacterium]|nr:ATP-binding cassette domain-containing protein [Bacillota bacterium]